MRWARSIITRLHLDEGGLTTIDFVMSLPALLIAVIAMKHAGALMLMRQDLEVPNRTAAWSEARNGYCLGAFDVGAIVDSLWSPTAPRCSDVAVGKTPTMGDFWSAAPNEVHYLLDKVKGAETPIWVKAEASASYLVNKLGPDWNASVSATYIAPKAVFWTYNDAALTKGYNPVLRDLLGNSYKLFPRLLP